MAQLNLGRTLFEQGSLELAEKHLRRAKELFPEYAGSGSPYGYLARIHSRRAEPRRAAAELDALTSINGRDYDAQLELAAILESIDELEGAAASLERAIYIYPFEMSVHERLAAMATRIQKPELAIRERRAILALGPADQAEAHYQLALAYSAAGDERRARRAVLQALERAPNFEAAQDLLLELRAGGS